MAYSINTSFHGVSRIVVGSVDTHERDERSWQAVTLNLYDATGRFVDCIQFHSDDGTKLAVEHEAATAEAA